MFHIRIISQSILALLGSVSIGAAGSDHPDPLTVRAALEHRGASRSAAESSAAAPKPSALLAFSMLGTGTGATPTDGTCSGAVCNASSGGCLCLTFQGKLINATQIGNATWKASVTVNIDDCTNTGT